MAGYNCALSIISAGYSLLYLSVYGIERLVGSHCYHEYIKSAHLALIFAVIMIGLCIALAVFADEFDDSTDESPKINYAIRYDTMCWINSVVWFALGAIEIVRLFRGLEYVVWGAIWVTLMILNLIFLNIDRRKIKLRFGRKRIIVKIVRERAQK